MDVLKYTKIIIVLGAIFLNLAEAKSVKLAVVSPLAIAPGDAIRKGAELAVEQRAAEFKKLGIDLSLVAFDDQASPNKGKNIAQNVVADKDFFGVIGALNSSVSHVLGKSFAESQLAMITPTSTNAELTRNGWLHFSRLVAPDHAQSVAAAQYINKRLQAKRILVISDNTTYGNGLCTTLISVLEKEEYSNIKLMEYRGASNRQQYLNAISQIYRKKPDLIYFGGAERVGAELISSIRRAGIDTRVMAGDGLDNPDFKTLAGEYASGVTFTTVFGSFNRAKSFSTFNLMFKNKYQEESTGISVLSFDAANVLLDAVKKSLAGDPSKLSREKVSRFVREIDKKECKLTRCGNVSGAISFSVNGERSISRVVIMRYGQAAKAIPLRYQRVYARDLNFVYKR